MQTRITKKTAQVMTLLADTHEGAAGAVDPRVATVTARLTTFVGADLELRLEGYITALTQLGESLGAVRRLRVESECANELGIVLKKVRTENQIDTAKSTTEGKTQLESKAESDKRSLSKRYVEMVGGHDKGWVMSPTHREFINGTTLPKQFQDRLLSMVNTDIFSIKSFSLAKAATPPKAADFAVIGEMVFAHWQAKSFVLGEAYAKGVAEKFVWTDTVLDSEVEDVTRSAVALAMRDAQGISIKDGGKVLDIFSSKAIKDMIGETDEDTTTTKQVTVKGTKRPEKPSWLTDLVKVKNPTVICTTCQGAGHSTCKGGSFLGWCSRCHGYGHKSNQCQSTV